MKDRGRVMIYLILAIGIFIHHKKWIYTFRHKIAFLKVEKQLLGRNTLDGWLHDVDKLFLYFLPIPKKWIQKIHRSLSTHHVETLRRYTNWEQVVIDWECSRYTKPDKPENAYNTLYKHYPQVERQVLPVLYRLGLMEKIRG